MKHVDLLTMRLRSHLLLLAVAVFAPMTIGAGVALHMLSDHERAVALTAHAEAARAMSLVIDREVHGAIRALQALSTTPAFSREDFSAVHAQAQALSSPPDHWLFVLDERAVQVINAISPFGAAPPAPTALAQKNVARILRNGKPGASDLISGAVTGRRLTSVYVPAVTAQGRRYVPSQALTVEHWRKALALQLPSDWVVSVIDRHGRFIFRSHDTDRWVGQSTSAALTAQAATQAKGVVVHRDAEGPQTYESFHRSERTGWLVSVAVPAAVVQAAAMASMAPAVLGTLIALACATAGLFIIARRFSRSIQTIRTAAVDLGSGRQPTRGTCGVQELDVVLGEMVDAGKLLAVEHNARLGAEAQLQQWLERERAARELAEADNQAKDRFMALLGHELRNPLAALAGAAQVLQRLGDASPKAGRFVDIVVRQTDHLTRITNDLVDISRLHAGKVHLECQDLELSGAVRACVEALHTAGKLAAVRVELDLQPARVHADPVRIEQIFNNLMVNAVKYSPPNGLIRVAIRQEDAWACVSVSDQGAGIEPQLLPCVFEAFVQGPPPPNQAPGGLGIGLALVRQLVELHGGEIAAASPGAGQGSTFTVWLPRIDVDAAHGHPASARRRERADDAPRGAPVLQRGPLALDQQARIEPAVGTACLDATSGGMRCVME